MHFPSLRYLTTHRSKQQLGKKGKKKKEETHYSGAMKCEGKSDTQESGI